MHVHWWQRRSILDRFQIDNARHREWILVFNALINWGESVAEWQQSDDLEEANFVESSIRRVAVSCVLHSKILWLIALCRWFVWNKREEFGSEFGEVEFLLYRPCCSRSQYSIFLRSSITDADKPFAAKREELFEETFDSMMLSVVRPIWILNQLDSKQTVVCQVPHASTLQISWNARLKAWYHFSWTRNM